MTDGANSRLTAQLAAALDWWRDAGVDGHLHDGAQAWIAPAKEATKTAAPSVAAPAQAPAPPAPPALDRSGWPAELAAFSAWWLADPALDSAPPATRVPPRGAAGASLLVLVAEPEREDAGVLLSGPQGRLLAGFLAAAGIAPDAVYVASVLPRHTPHADWAEAAARGLGELARHHVALAAPRRLLVCGGNILPLLGHDPALNPAAFSEFEHGGATLPVLALRDLALLRERPRWKAAMWRAWLDWPPSRN